MGEIGRRFSPQALERHCSCGLCLSIRADRELREQAELMQLSQGDDLGEQNNSSEV